MDHLNIYLHFLGHVRPGDSANECACAKIKNRNIRNFGFYNELFHSLKHFRISSFIFTTIISQCYEKIAAKTKQTPVVCHMASHMALVMSSVTSGECVVCAYCKQN